MPPPSGAQPGVFGVFQRHVTGARAITLSQNYRSTRNIVQAATAVIKHNPGRVDKQVFTDAAPGRKVELCECRNAHLEADWVVSRVLALQQQGTPLSSIAVLYRTHAVGREIYKALKDHHIARAASSADVFARPDIAPLVNVLRLIANPHDDAAFRLVATGTTPAFDGALLDVLSTEALRTKASLYQAARQLHAASSGFFGAPTTAPTPAAAPSPLVGAPSPYRPPPSPYNPAPSPVGAHGGAVEPAATPYGAHGSARAAAALDDASRRALHSLLHKLDELTTIARRETPSALLQAIIRSGVQVALNPQAPPHGAKLLADELATALPHAPAQPESLHLPPATPAGGYAGGYAGGHDSSAAAARMPPPPRPADKLTALRHFLEHQALSEVEFAGVDGRDAKAGVSLSTIHGAKGREWPVVLVVRVNEDILPLCLGAADEGGGASAECVAEERRLLYVAMTRAREQLLLSYVMMGEDKVPS